MEVQLPTQSQTQSGIALEQAKDFILSYNFNQIINRLIYVEGWRTKTAQIIIEQYRHFLYLKKKYQTQYRIVPSKDIDEAWHAHLLYSQDYTAFCQQYFGYYMHHHPVAALGKPKTDSAIIKDFNKTQELHKKEFGDYLYAVRGSALCRQLRRWYLQK